MRRLVTSFVGGLILTAMLGSTAATQPALKWETLKVGTADVTVIRGDQNAPAQPLVLLSIGLPGGARSVEGLARALASRGYVVVVAGSRVELMQLLKGLQQVDSIKGRVDWTRVGLIGQGTGVVQLDSVSDDGETKATVKARVYLFGDGKWEVAKGPALVVGGLPGTAASTRPYSEGAERGDRWLLLLERGEVVSAVRNMGGERGRRFEACAGVVGVFLDAFVKGGEGEEEAKNLMISGSVVGQYVDVARIESR